MSLAILSIFGKNREAGAGIKGFEYQKLRTLQYWLHNRVHGIQESIFCEYEDDIFQRDELLLKSKFRQVKLYGSKNFHLKSDEVRKAIANFFTNYVNGKYSLDEVEFVFETNTGIARDSGDNDAALLEAWYQNQDRLEGQLLALIVEKIRAIVTEYVVGEYEKLVEKKDPKAEDAMQFFNSLRDNVWEDFVRCIRWDFAKLQPDDALKQTHTSIFGLIKRLQFPAAKSDPQGIFDALYHEVSERMFQDRPEDRALTNEKLDHLVLNRSSGADKQYNTVYQLWTKDPYVSGFNLGQFLQVTDACQYCRRSSYLKQHRGFWIDVLEQYVAMAEQIGRYGVKGIYEILMMEMVVDIDTWEVSGSLAGREAIIATYVERSKPMREPADVESQLNVLQSVFGAMTMNVCSFPEQEWDSWCKRLEEVIDQERSDATHPDQLCDWWELTASFQQFQLTLGRGGVKLDDIINSYDQLIKVLDRAPFFDLGRLYSRLNSLRLIYIKSGGQMVQIDAIEGIVQKLTPIQKERLGNVELANTSLKAAMQYLENGQPEYTLNALDHLHRLQEFWRYAETEHKYVLALLDTARVYNKLNLNYAAKYYCLGAIGFCLHQPSDKMKRWIFDACCLMTLIEYEQGNWMGVLLCWHLCNLTGAPFVTTLSDTARDRYQLSGMKVAKVVSLLPLLSPQLLGFISFLHTQMGQEDREGLASVAEGYVQLMGKRSIAEVLNDVATTPIGDLGPVRTISWQAYGSTFNVSFVNDWQHTAVGEEFAGFMQIVLVELRRAKIDLHLMAATVNIDVVMAEQQLPVEQLPDNSSYRWRYFANEVTSFDNMPKQMHLARMYLAAQYILRDMSGISDEAMEKTFMSFFEKRNLSGKTMLGHLYQKTFRQFFAKEQFDAQQRANFQPYKAEQIGRAVEGLPYDRKLSPLYSPEESLRRNEIRYHRGLKSIHLTLAKLKVDSRYSTWLSGLRAAGWLDWHIIMGIGSVACQYKAESNVRAKNPAATFENSFEEINREMNRILREDEAEHYQDIPHDIFFIGRHFEDVLLACMVDVLNTWGMSYKAKFPNWPALKQLAARFGFWQDDVPDQSPL